MDASKTHAHEWNINVISFCMWSNCVTSKCDEGFFFDIIFPSATSVSFPVCSAHFSFWNSFMYLQAEGIPVSPYSVRRALENTSTPVGDLPEDKLSTGQGLMQVDKYGSIPFI